MVTQKKSKEKSSLPSFINTVSALQKITEFREDVALKINQVMVDNETIRKDSAYELFYIRKKNGSRFFNLKQLKNIKTATDIGDYFENIDQNNIETRECKDRMVNIGAINILKTLSSKINRFFHESNKNRKVELVRNLYSSIMALMLASHRENRLNNFPAKCCLEYYKDFQHYLYTSLQSKEYQKLIVYPPSETNVLAHSILDLIHSMCKSQMLHFGNYQELIPFIHEWTGKKEIDIYNQNKKLSHELSNEYEVLKKKLKTFSYMPLRLILQDIEKGEANFFAPLKQENYPIQLYSIYYQDKKCLNLHMPGPVHQDYIDNSFVDEVFLGYLKSLQKDQLLNKHLIVNLQDRTHWRESARSRVIESLEKASLNKRCLNVITLPMDTDFYHQSSPYADNHNFEIFFEHFMTHINDPSSGFYFSEEIKESIFPKFCNDLGRGIYRVFFASKSDLTVSERRNFIDLFYFFLVVKIIEITHSDLFNLSCKDAIDLGGSLNLMFYAILKCVNNASFSKTDIDFILYLLVGVPLIQRGRMMFKERVERFFSLLVKLEKLKETYGGESLALLISEGITPLYQSKLLNGQVVPAHLL